MQKGFSFLELITVILVIGLVSAFGIPHFTQFLMRQERELVLNRLKTAIEFAKQEAIAKGKIVTICASRDQKTCATGDWTDGFIVFIHSNNHPVHTKAIMPLEILQVFPGIRFGQLYFEQFATHLNIQPDGMTINSGIFTYCPKNQDRTEADALILNHACRTYRPTERNHLGIFIKKEGTATATPLTCR